MLEFGSDRQCAFAPGVFDFRRTTAHVRVHEPIRRETVLIHDDPWESGFCGYHNFFFDDSYTGTDGTHKNGVYRMYYICRGEKNGVLSPGRVGYAESADGIHFEKPMLGMTEIDGSSENNIIADEKLNPDFDNFAVFRDDNPACPPEKRYKGIASMQDPRRLCAFYSADGLHFSFGRVITENGLTVDGMFDSLSVMFWDVREQVYRGFFRYNHFPCFRPEERLAVSTVHDIMYLESPDFETFKKPKALYYMGSRGYSLTSSNILPYFRAPQLLIGFPTRYVPRKSWGYSFDAIPGREKRITLMQEPGQRGLAAADCIFMVSEDGKNFCRFESAFLRPGAEDGNNWLCGDCVPAYGLALTDSLVPGEEKQISLYVPSSPVPGVPVKLNRYSIRQDGFVSLHADGDREETVITEEFTYTGSELYANISTSARGYMFFKIMGEENGESIEVFGDASEKRIPFPHGFIASMQGKPVRMQIRMRDADLYSFRFGDPEEKP